MLSKKALELSTVKRKVKLIKSLMKHGVEISNLDSVVAFLNTCSWENGTKQRKRMASKLKNPRIEQISLRTFRHWKATMVHVKTKDILYVKEFLDHVNINNTLKYSILPMP